MIIICIYLLIVFLVNVHQKGGSTYHQTCETNWLPPQSLFSCFLTQLLAVSCNGTLGIFWQVKVKAGIIYYKWDNSQCYSNGDHSNVSWIVQEEIGHSFQLSEMQGLNIAGWIPGWICSLFTSVRPDSDHDRNAEGVWSWKAWFHHFPYSTFASIRKTMEHQLYIMQWFWGFRSSGCSWKYIIPTSFAHITPETSANCCFSATNFS